MADIPDTNNAPDSNQVAPQNPTVQPNLPQANPAMPTQAPQVTPAASPSGAPNTPQGQGAVAPTAGTPAQPQTPAQQHASIYHKVFSLLNGGGNRPQYEPSTLSDGSANPRAGQPMTNPDGTVKMGQASTKQLGMGILAGAISGMMAGMATPSKFNEVAPGRFQQDYSGSVAAGAQAGQKFSQQGQQTEAQKQADINTTRQYTTLKNNLDMHVLMQGVHRGDTQDFQTAVDSFKETLDNAQDEQDAGNLKDKDGKPIQLIRDGEYTNEQGLAMLQKREIKSTQSQMIPSRVIQAPNDPTDPSKGMHPVMMYKILTDAGVGLGTLPLTDAMKKELGSKWDNAPVDTTMVPISLLLQNAHVRATSAQAGGTVNDWKNELKAVDPNNAALNSFDYGTWSASNPADAKAINQVLTAHKGQHADIGLNQILTNKDFSGDAKVMSALNKLQTAMGVNADALTAMANTRAEALAQGKKDDAKKPADPVRIQNAPALLAAKNTNLSAASLADYKSRLHAGMTNDELDKVMKDATTESEKITNQQLAQDNHNIAAAAKEDARIAKGQKPIVGIDSSGRQVLVPASDASKYGLTQVREIGQGEGEKVTNARTLLNVFTQDDPDDLGLMQLAMKLNKEGKLGPVASRFQDWLNKSGSVPTSLAGFDAGDPEVQQLFVKMGLANTGLMQVHVGARGSTALLEHFADLANAKTMGGDTLVRALDTETKYVRMKALLPQTGKQAQSPQKQQNQPQQNQNQGGNGHGKFDPNALPSVNQ